MKKAVVLFLCAILLTVCCVPVGAHSGNTDSHGGHYDRSTGEYHYHHGYSAHDHEDGECPYAYVKIILSIICLAIFALPAILFWKFLLSVMFQKPTSDAAESDNKSKDTPYPKIKVQDNNTSLDDSKKSSQVASGLKHNPDPTILDNSSYKRKSNDTSPSNESPDDNSEGDSEISNLLGGIIVIGSLLFALILVCLAFA